MKNCMSFLKLCSVDYAKPLTVSYRLGLRLELPPSGKTGESTSKRKEPPFDEETKIRELERRMRLFDESGTHFTK